jgi:hypothetical protein
MMEDGEDVFLEENPDVTMMIDNSNNVQEGERSGLQFSKSFYHSKF